MTAERHVWEKCKRVLTWEATAESSKRQRVGVETLASVRALIINPFTTSETIANILETLLQCLQQDQQPLHHHVLLKLLADLSSNSKLSHIISSALLSHATSHNGAATILTVEALSIVVTIAEGNQNISELNEDFFLQLCSSLSASVRSWILLNASRFNVRLFVSGNIMLEFTKDPYPYVRRAALNGLVELSKLVNTKESKLIEGCYDRGVELLVDSNDCVRSAAIDVVITWGLILAESDNGVDKKDWCDAVFVQLCSMARDMSVEVRISAFASLGKIMLLSEDMLLQTLSKKVKGGIKGKQVIGQCRTKEFDMPASNVAGVFVHGVEDEFYEVRKSACKSLGMLSRLSVGFANDALHLLTDLLNDDKMVVRLQSLATMSHMVTCDSLKVKGMDMHMFLGTLLDACLFIRRAARNVLRLMKLTDVAMFKSSVNGLLTNLESYPEDEADIFLVLFHIGRGHANFAVRFVRDVSQEIQPSCEGELPFDKARVPAILVLAIAALLSNEPRRDSIPTRIYSYALTYVGRISRSLTSVISQDNLLACLSHFSKFTRLLTLESFCNDEHLIPVAEEGIPNPTINATINHVSPLLQLSYGISESQSLGEILDPRNIISVNETPHKPTIMHEELTNAVGLILEIVAGAFPLIKLGCTDEVQRTLRRCKEELATIAMDSHGYVDLLAFAVQYIRVIQLIAKIWEHLMPSRQFYCNSTGILDLSMEKLDRNLKQLRYGFLGFSKEEELHILDIVLLFCVFRLSKAEICSHLATLMKLRATISRIEVLRQNEGLSDFHTELKKFSQKVASDCEASCCPFPLKIFLESFSFKRLVFIGRFKHISGELNVPGNNSENPLLFISGLPVGITFQITLRYVSSEDRIWLTLVAEELTQFVFLDLNQFEDCDNMRKLTLSVPYYITPKVASFSLRACIGKECPLGDLYLGKGQGGPKCELSFLCSVKEVYLSMRS